MQLNPMPLALSQEITIMMCMVIEVACPKMEAITRDILWWKGIRNIDLCFKLNLDVFQVQFTQNAKH